MGSGKRIIPARLGEKLRMIRESLDLTTEEIITKLNCPQVPLHRASITQYEKNRREPPLMIILNYARLARVNVEILIDDDQSLEAVQFSKINAIDKNKKTKIPQD